MTIDAQCNSCSARMDASGPNVPEKAIRFWAGAHVKTEAGHSVTVRTKNDGWIEHQVFSAEKEAV